MTIKISRRNMIKFSALSGIILSITGCNTLQAFNKLTPKDKESILLAKDLVYGTAALQKYDIYGPKEAHGKLPIIVFFYGGAWNSGNKDEYVWAGRSLAALGYIVALPNYRLVPEVHFPVFVEDCALAFKHIRANSDTYNGDKDKIILMGHSSGAYNASMLALDNHYLGADHAAVKAFIGISGPYDFYPFDVRESIDAFSNWPHPNETQPVNFATKKDIKFLLLQSRSDIIVGSKNSINLELALKASGNEVELKFYENVTHQEMVASLSIPFRNKASVREDIEIYLNNIFPAS